MSFLLLLMNMNMTRMIPMRIKYAFIFTCLVVTSFSTFAESKHLTKFLDRESEILKCGNKNIQIKSSCFDIDEDNPYKGSAGSVRSQCRNVRLIIKDKQAEIVKKYPFISAWQLRKIESYGYKLGKIINFSEKNPYSPMSMACIKHKSRFYISLTYSLSPYNMKYGEYDDNLNNLIDNPVVMDLNGNYESKTLSEKINNIVYGSQHNTRFISANVMFVPER